MATRTTLQYRTYRFINKDPSIDAIRGVVQAEKLKSHLVGQIAGVAAATLDNWFEGDTKCPRNSTLSAVSSSLGYVRRDTLDKQGQLHIRYVKMRDINDWKTEVKKTGDFLLKQNRNNKKRNGKNWHTRNGR